MSRNAEHRCVDGEGCEENDDRPEPYSDLMASMGISYLRKGLIGRFMIAEERCPHGPYPATRESRRAGAAR